MSRLKRRTTSAFCCTCKTGVTTILYKPNSSYNLRSNSSLLLEPPKEKILSTLGARSFYAAAPVYRLSCVIFNHYVVLNEKDPPFSGRLESFFLCIYLCYLLIRIQLVLIVPLYKLTRFLSELL